ncbi:MAG TPA: hypothetical protein VIA07_07530 [Desulfuromonadales bacterium]
MRKIASRKKLPFANQGIDLNPAFFFEDGVLRFSGCFGQVENFSGEGSLIKVSQAERHGCNLSIGGSKKIQTFGSLFSLLSVLKKHYQRRPAEGNSLAIRGYFPR